MALILRSGLSRPLTIKELDQNFVYLDDLLVPATLVAAINAAGGVDADTLDGVDSTGFVVQGTLTAAQLNNANSLSAGIYTNNGDGILDPAGAAFVAGYFYIIHMHTGIAAGYEGQIAVGYAGTGAGMLFFRFAAAGTWSAWIPFFTPLNEDGRGRTNQCFLLQLRNNAGTLEHRVVSLSQTGLTDYTLTSKITGDSPSWTTTPTGADASTDFATGVKISASATNKIILNTADQVGNGDQAFDADLSLSNVTGSKGLIRCRCDLVSRNVNSVTIYRPEIAFQYLDTGTMTWTSFALTTANIASGKILSVRCSGFLR